MHGLITTAATAQLSRPAPWTTRASAEGLTEGAEGPLLDGNLSPIK